MKYEKLLLYTRRPSMVSAAYCLSGENATILNCKSGQEASVGCGTGLAANERCQSGSAPAEECKAGTGAEL